MAERYWIKVRQGDISASRRGMAAIFEQGVIINEKFSLFNKILIARALAESVSSITASKNIINKKASTYCISYN